MNSKSKRTQAPGAAPQPPARRAGPVPQLRPAAAQPKAATPARAASGPAAPRVYRPQPAPQVLQTKQAAGWPAPQRDPRPPAPRAGQPARPAAQAKGALTTGPSAPAARPAVLQRKEASGCCHSRLSRAPSVQSSPRRTASAAGGAGAGVIQRIQCNVTQNGKVVGSSPKVGKGGTPGVSHAEQKAWNAMSSAIAAGDIIKFHVDGPICAGCTAWFENTAYPAVHGAGATLMVNVLYNEPGNTQFYGTIEVTGPGTVWGKVSEKGYYGPTGKAESEVLRLLAKAAT